MVVVVSSSQPVGKHPADGVSILYKYVLSYLPDRRVADN